MGCRDQKMWINATSANTVTHDFWPVHKKWNGLIPPSCMALARRGKQTCLLFLRREVGKSYHAGRYDCKTWMSPFISTIQYLYSGDVYSSFYVNTEHIHHRTCIAWHKSSHPSIYLLSLIQFQFFLVSTLKTTQLTKVLYTVDKRQLKDNLIRLKAQNKVRVKLSLKAQLYIKFNK